METTYLCPDCGHQHNDPAEALLGILVRCLDCQIEIDLTFELQTLPRPLIAA